MDLPTFIAKWKQSAASERANKDSFLRDLCDVLGVPHPDAKTGDSDRDRYVFEREALLVHGGERTSVGFIDLYKHGCFILEAKQGPREVRTHGLAEAVPRHRDQAMGEGDRRARALDRLAAMADPHPRLSRSAPPRSGIRWLRPEFQNPSGTVAASQADIVLEDVPEEAKAKEVPAWPKELRDQVSAVRDLFNVDGRAAKSWTAEEVSRAFRGARRADVASVLEALSSLGILLTFETPAGRRWRAA